MIDIKTNSYNLQIAKRFGINSAVLIELVDKKIAEGMESSLNLEVNTIPLTRSYIYNTIGLDMDKQLEVEQALVMCGVMSIKPFRNVNDKNYYTLNYEVFEKLLNMSEDEIIPFTEVKKVVPQKVERETKKQCVLNALKNSIKEDNDLIRQYLCDWVDSIFESKKGTLTCKGIELSINELHAYTSNVDTIIEIIKIAIVRNWRDFSWAIQEYEKKNKVNTDTNFVSYSDIKSDGNNVVDEAF